MQSIFEIQVSSGGGQFITVFKGTPKVINNWDTFSFSETAGTDLRIKIISGNVKISEVKIIH